jgi:hypothetical protein
MWTGEAVQLLCFCGTVSVSDESIRIGNKSVTASSKSHHSDTSLFCMCYDGPNDLVNVPGVDL